MKIMRKKNTGFTLIEVMVALAVLSIGMLGIASLFTQSLGATRTTQYRGQAINLLTDMADRIRVNRSAEAAYEGAGADNNCDPAGGATCTPAEMAAHDLFVWGAQVQALLPGGAWTVAHDGTTAPPTYTITVTWSEIGEAAPVSAQFDIQVPTI